MKTLEISPAAIVLDGMGVLYARGDQVGDGLIPFARERGSNVSASNIRRLYTERSLGRLDELTFWRDLGIAGSAGQLDADFVATRLLTRGVLQFLTALRSVDVSVAVISNDVVEWSEEARRRYGLDHWIESWTISGEVGARKPDALIYSWFLDNNDFAARDCLFVDDRVANLDAAAEFGFATALYAPDAKPMRCRHVVTERLEDLLSLRFEFARPASS